MTGRQARPRLTGHAFRETLRATWPAGHDQAVVRVWACECGTDFGTSTDYARREAQDRHHRHKERVRADLTGGPS